MADSAPDAAEASSATVTEPASEPAPAPALSPSSAPASAPQNASSSVQPSASDAESDAYFHSLINRVDDIVNETDTQTGPPGPPELWVSVLNMHSAAGACVNDALDSFPAEQRWFMVILSVVTQLLMTTITAPLSGGLAWFLTFLVWTVINQGFIFTLRRVLPTRGNLWKFVGAGVSLLFGIITIALMASYANNSDLVGQCFIVFIISYPVNAILECLYLSVYFFAGGAPYITASSMDVLGASGEYIQHTDNAPIDL